MSRRAILAVLVAAVVAVPVVAVAAGSGYTPPCTNTDSISCQSQRIAALESAVASLNDRLTSTSPPSTTPSSTPTTTSPSTSPSVTPSSTVSPTPTVTPSPSTTPTPAVCKVSTLDHAQCGPYASTTIKGGSNDSGPSIRQEVWNPDPNALKKQATVVYSPAHWETTINAAASNTAVNSYPDVSNTVTSVTNTPVPASSYSSITSTWSENMHTTAATNAEAAYDIWLGNYAFELMIWVDTVKQRPAGTDTGKTITVAGVPYRLWDTPGHSTVSLVRANTQVGSVDILGIVKALIANGTYASTIGFNQIDFGFETPSTGGVDEVFTVNDYTLAYTCATSC